MLVHERLEKIFRELGLTSSQSRVYLSLVNLAYPSSAKEISTFSNIARQDIYHTLTELQELSLVETVIGSPALFKTVSLQEAIAILNKRKKEKMHDLLTEVRDLLKISMIKQSKVGNDNYRFILIPKKERCINKVKKAIETAQESILAITPWREATQWLFILHDTWSKALNRGIEVLWITERQENGNSLTKSTHAVLEHPNFKLRTGLNFFPPEIRFAIYDGKEALIATSNAQNATESPALWTNNLVTVCILKDYFQMKWKNITDET